MDEQKLIEALTKIAEDAAKRRDATDPVKSERAYGYWSGVVDTAVAAARIVRAAQDAARAEEG